MNCESQFHFERAAANHRRTGPQFTVGAALILPTLPYPGPSALAALQEGESL